jgi:hypothetical protein
MVELVEAYKEVYRSTRGGPVPAEPVQAARALDRGGVQELGLEAARVKYRRSTGITG